MWNFEEYRMTVISKACGRTTHKLHNMIFVIQSTLKMIEKSDVQFKPKHLKRLVDCQLQIFKLTKVKPFFVIE